MFLGTKDPRYPTYRVLKMGESTEQLCINFNFVSKVKAMYNVPMPDIEHSDLIQVISSEPNPALGFSKFDQNLFSTNFIEVSPYRFCCGDC
jgi:hypothetical protein